MERSGVTCLVPGLAKREEVNILHRLTYPEQRVRFFASILDRRDWVESIVAHHLNLALSQCCMDDFENWYHGSFNVCIPVTIKTWKWKQQPGHRVILRLPLPYRVGDAFRLGNGDEKVFCEAATYTWLQMSSNSKGQAFTRLQSLPHVARWFQRLRRRLLSLLGALFRPTNFFRDLSRIILTVTRIPLSKIGSFTIDADGFLQLTNRPLAIEIQDLQNEDIPTNIPRDQNYSSYLPDCHGPSFFNPDLRYGPFSFMLTDLHESNIFVDENWQITYLVDPEWAFVRPLEMLDIPTCLKEGWQKGTFWYRLALESPTSLFTVFYRQIQPRFLKKGPNLAEESFAEIMPSYWAEDYVDIARRKLSDREE
ncbi:hypothetical protein BDW59DRAFT_168807 [Aspergillus cavernicola]|uniref:Aminoglycoside phosphotransferase domain-containing protein n=1 Tax=Aspergillus cavernicola TaxID=176166 RepID=A0ABR4J110_9EURO